MICPNCQKEQYFCCNNKNCRCWRDLPKDCLSQIQLGNIIFQCPYCGFTAHIDFWNGIEVKSLEK